MQYKITDAMNRMLQARQRIARRTPFFSSLVYNAKLVETDRHNTIVTDGINVYFNPAYVTAKENSQFIEGDFLKCVMHMALLHVPRKQWREIEKWNKSSTLSVGPIVHQYFQQHPALMVHDAKFDNKAAEEVYELLEDEEGKGKGKGNPPPPSSGDGKTPPGDAAGSMVEPNPEDQEAAEQAAKDWKNALANATEKAKKAGNMPGNLQRLIEELQPADILNWHDIIRDMSRDAKAKITRTWSKPNRRRLGADVMAPGYVNDNIFKLIAAFDVSGSVNDGQHKEMKNALASAIEQGFFTSILLVAVDTCIHDPVEITTKQELEAWAPHGGGGTCFESAMNFIAEQENVAGLVFLSDLETSSFGKEPPFPTVWVNWLNNNTKAPYGRTVRYDAK
jgi:predicted metal-dependent peptidase